MKIVNKIKTVIKTLLAMGGILTDNFKPHRILYLFLIAALYLVNLYLAGVVSLKFAIGYFLIAFFIRYLFLFNSFRKNGIAGFLKKKFGEVKGFEIYRLITAFMFFQGANSFSLLVLKSSGFYNAIGNADNIIKFIGILIFLTGFTVNLWSALLVGIDIYYYKDLFLGRPIGKFTKKGPYLLFSNPMYGIGQASGYGTALIYGSVAGLAGILLNQVLMYIFYYTFEKPHIKKISGEINYLERVPIQ